MQSADSETPSSDIGPETLLPSSSTAEVLHYIEGFSLAVMCSTRPTTRKLAMIILKEVRTLHQLLGLNQNSAEETVMTVIEKIASSVVHKCLSLLPEKTRVRWFLLYCIPMIGMCMYACTFLVRRC